MTIIAVMTGLLMMKMDVMTMVVLTVLLLMTMGMPLYPTRGEMMLVMPPLTLRTCGRLSTTTRSTCVCRRPAPLILLGDGRLACLTS